MRHVPCPFVMASQNDWGRHWTYRYCMRRNLQKFVYDVALKIHIVLFCYYCYYYYYYFIIIIIVISYFSFVNTL